MMTKKAKTLMCPWTFNQDPRGTNSTSFYMCVTEKCMAWEDDGYVPMPEDNSVKLFMGHCKLIDGEASR